MHVYWVGRRGVHCWVCDKEARILPNDARGAIVEYLSIETGISDNSDKQLKNTFQNPHPMMIRAYEILEPCFSTYIADGEGQGLLARKDRYMKVLNSLPNEHIRVELYEKWEKNDTLSGKKM
jgi:DNA primase small subunit